MLTGDLAADPKPHALRFVSNGEVVSLSKLPDGKYHVFLSHAQKYGADQVADIKNRLERMIEGCSCFLDVDALRLLGAGSLGQLPGIVRDTKVLLIFLTDDVFTYWVASELRTALKAHTAIIPVIETDPRHGALSLAQAEAQCPKDVAAKIFEADPIKWFRDVHTKTISLKKIAQRLLVFTEPVTFRIISSWLSLPGEIQSLHFGSLPLLEGRQFHAYITHSDVSIQIQDSLVDLFTGHKIDFRIAPTNPNSDEDSERLRHQAIAASCALIAPLYGLAMLDERVRSDLRFAQQQGIHVIMLHVRHVGDGPEDNQFAAIMENCPKDIASELFADLAIEWHLAADYISTSTQLVWQRMSSLCNKGKEHITTTKFHKRHLPARQSASDTSPVAMSRRNLPSVLPAIVADCREPPSMLPATFKQEEQKQQQKQQPPVMQADVTQLSLLRSVPQTRTQTTEL